MTLLAVTEVTWPGVVQAFVGNLPATIMAVASLITAIAAIQKINSVHKDVNSRMDQLLKSSGEVQHAAGVTEGEGGRGPMKPGGENTTVNMTVENMDVGKMTTTDQTRPPPDRPKNGPQL